MSPEEASWMYAAICGATPSWSIASWSRHGSTGTEGGGSSAIRYSLTARTGPNAVSSPRNRVASAASELRSTDSDLSRRLAKQSPHSEPRRGGVAQPVGRRQPHERQDRDHPQ